MNHKSIFLACIVVNYLVLTSCHESKQEFHEELYIKPLSNHFVYTYFQFTTLWSVPAEKSTFEHCDIFPRWLGELIGRHNIAEIHLSLTKGLWNHRLWGYPFVQAPPGAELFATFKNSSNVDKDWLGVCGGLSGLVCASLNFIEPSTSWIPELLQGNDPNSRYSSLPRETVCTENLTPFLKLIPCYPVGLSSLLNTDQVYNTVYHSLGIHFRILPNGSIELKQTVSLVYDLVLIGSGRNVLQNQRWSIQRLFRRGITSRCPIADSASLYLDVSFNQTVGGMSVSPEGIGIPKVVTRGGSKTYLLAFDLLKTSVPNVDISFTKTFPNPLPPLLYASTFISGSGQEFGGLTTKIYNNHWKKLKVLFNQNMPWFVPVYYHSVRVEDNLGGSGIVPSGPVLRTAYGVGKDRERGYSLEIELLLSPRSVTTISIDMDYSFLKWQEYPPDANHGFYLPATSVTSFLPTAANYTPLPPEGSLISSLLTEDGSLSRLEGYPVRVTTEILILSLPTPDFSMPYNVICLACTVVALAFGPLHNITTKKFVIADEKEVKKGLFDQLFSRFQCFKKSTSDSSTSEEPTNNVETVPAEEISESDKNIPLETKKNL